MVTTVEPRRTGRLCETPMKVFRWISSTVIRRDALMLLTHTHTHAFYICTQPFPAIPMSLVALRLDESKLHANDCSMWGSTVCVLVSYCWWKLMGPACCCFQYKKFSPLRVNGLCLFVCVQAVFVDGLANCIWFVQLGLNRHVHIICARLSHIYIVMIINGFSIDNCTSVSPQHNYL